MLDLNINRSRSKDDPMTIGLIDIMSALIFLFILFSFFFLVVLREIDIKYKKTKLSQQALINDKNKNFLSKDVISRKYVLKSKYESIKKEYEKEKNDKNKNYISRYTINKDYILKSKYNNLNKIPIKIIIPNKFKGKIFFKSGSASISKEFYPLLKDQIKKIKKHLNEGFNFIQVEGYTDSKKIRMNNRYKYKDNWDLGAARAISVVRFFEANGISSVSLSAVSYSKYHPVGRNKNKNRRIEITLLKQ